MPDQTELITQFTQELVVLRHRLAELRTSKALTDVAAATLRETVEKLQSAEEEIRLQNDALIATRQAEAAMQKQYEALFTLAPDAYLVTDARGTIVQANQAAATLFGIARVHLLGTSLLGYVAPEERQRVQTQLTLLTTPARVQDWELHLQSHTGDLVPVSMTIATGQRAHETPHTLLWLIRDMTARQHLEEELRRAEHLALLGKLAAGVAHEIRNPLGAIFLHTDLLEEELQQFPVDLRPLIAEPLAEIRTELTRLHEIVEDYLSLARLQRLECVLTDLGAFMAAFVQEIQPRCATHGITLHCAGAGALGAVVLHPSTFRRALLNLVQNAIDAMPQGGTLTIWGKHDAVQVQLEVCDTGTGIPTEQLHQIFEPLHTTKPQGTGLGLYVTREIITAHGGTIVVQSPPGCGATFTITLPVAIDTPPGS
jgi:PAS domain S-box-containing protein